MGDIKRGLSQFELNRSEELKQALLDDLKNVKKTKQVIRLNGKSSLVFANLAALTLASCGGGGGSSEAPTPTLSFSNQSFTFNEDTPGTFSISSKPSSSITILGCSWRSTLLSHVLYLKTSVPNLNISEI